jgi:hypothetical protein
MGVFKSSKTFDTTVPDLAPVAHAVMDHFRGKGFEVAGHRTILQGWDIDIHKGGAFQAVVGLKTALKIRIETAGASTKVEAGVGIFGQEAIPTAISMIVFWPVLVTQIWGIVQQSKLDEEALEAVAKALQAPDGGAAMAKAPRFCHECRAGLAATGKFCSECGAKM